MCLSSSLHGTSCGVLNAMRLTLLLGGLVTAMLKVGLIGTVLQKGFRVMDKSPSFYWTCAQIIHATLSKSMPPDPPQRLTHCFNSMATMLDSPVLDFAQPPLPQTFGNIRLCRARLRQHAESVLTQTFHVHRLGLDARPPTLHGFFNNDSPQEQCR